MTLQAEVATFQAENQELRQRLGGTGDAEPEAKSKSKPSTNV